MWLPAPWLQRNPTDEAHEKSRKKGRKHFKRQRCLLRLPSLQEREAAHVWITGTHTCVDHREAAHMWITGKLHTCGPQGSGTCEDLYAAPAYYNRVYSSYTPLWSVMLLNMGSIQQAHVDWNIKNINSQTITVREGLPVWVKVAGQAWKSLLIWNPKEDWERGCFQKRKTAGSGFFNR